MKNKKTPRGSTQRKMYLKEESIGHTEEVVRCHAARENSRSILLTPSVGVSNISMDVCKGSFDAIDEKLDALLKRVR